MPYQPKQFGQELQALAKKKKEYMKLESQEKLTWCSGCGDYGIQKALERALVLEALGTQDLVIFFDIGCHGNGSDKIGAYAFHGLHGRVIPVAAAAALANPKLKVIAEGGDGGTLSEGINHLVHAVRSNYPMVFILHNNENYGLTIGQVSSTTRCGQPMNGSPDGVPVPPMNACQFVLGLNPTFVARTYSGDVKHMTEILRAGLRHNGFAFIEVMQLCPTFNKATSANWFWDRIRYTDQIKGYDPGNLDAALKVSRDLDEKIAMGILYRDKKSVNFLEHLPARKGIKTALVEEVKPYEVGKLLEAFE